MRLRLRLAVTTLAVAVPLLFALAWINQRSRNTEEHQRLVTSVLTHMLAGGRAQCEAAPGAWSARLGASLPLPGQAPPFDAPAGPPEPGASPGPPGKIISPEPSSLEPHVELFAYDAALASKNPHAPALKVEKAASLQAPAGEEIEVRAPAEETRILVRMPWMDGPCTYVMAIAPRRQLPILPPTELWLVPMLAALLGMLISVGPMVSRMRRLAREVRRSAEADYVFQPAITGGDEIGDLARAFIDAEGAIRAQKELQERREKALRNFLANTTHDVMIPLAALQGHIAELLSHFPEGASAANLQRREVVAAADEAHYIGSLVHNLGIAARLEAGEPDPVRVPVDLGALVERAKGRHVMIARQHGIAVESGVPPEPVVVEGDITLLEQMVGNVIGNAIKYNRDGGHVAVLLAREGAERFSLRVIDDGPGIADADRARILERGFRTSAARTRSPGGQGLGLSIAAEVARRHGLMLEVKRSEYGGLEVVFAGSCKPAAPA